MLAHLDFAVASAELQELLALHYTERNDELTVALRSRFGTFIAVEEVQVSLEGATV